MPAKAKYSEPCSRCGVCCASSLCPAAEVAFPSDTAPCRALVFDEQERAVCGLVKMEETLGIEPLVVKILGIGCGCSCPDVDTSAEQIIEFDRQARIRVFEKKDSSNDL